ncbi:retrovirus-related pol polyprotein from transposon TNT 1-94 [Tanacetum coccineum]|uniref:Retrovirus-related pol polyprotein from transposon TNT 1-94 n=1 Tax=Tanacetum coccineum TaxID=301880 RepID=A0ABQ5JC98_9ASTR
MTVAGAKETVGSQVVQQTGIQCFNCKGYGHYAKECRKPKRVKDYAYHKEKMMMCKQAEQGVPLQAEQADWLEDTDEEIDEQELEAHYSYMAKIQDVSPEESSSTGQPLEQVQNHNESNVYDNVRRHSEQPESINDTYVLEKDDSNVTPDSSNICTNDNQVDQNAAECVDERAALANLIANLSGVEGHIHRISSISKKTKSVTACNDSSKSKTLNVNAVCAECGKCVFNSNHDACVSRYLKDVNARTKKPKVVPISASKPKRKANKSVATPHKKTVASDTTIQKSKSYHKELYENTNQEWKWWISKRCPSGYIWTQKPLRTKKIWMPKSRKEDVSTSISPTIDIVSRITNVLKISNSLGSNLSNVPSSSNSLADCTVRFGRNDSNLLQFLGFRGSDSREMFGQFCDADFWGYLEVAFWKFYLFCDEIFRGNDLLMALSDVEYDKDINFVHDYQDTLGLVLLRSKDDVTPEVLQRLSHDDSTQSSSKVISVLTDRGIILEQGHSMLISKKKDLTIINSTPRTPEQNWRVQEIGGVFLTTTLINNDVYSFQPQRSSNERTSSVRQTKSLGTRSTNHWQYVIKLMWFMEDKKRDEDTDFACLEGQLDFCTDHAAHKSFQSIEGRENGSFLNGPRRRRVLLLKPEGFVDQIHPENNSLLRKALTSDHLSPKDADQAGCIDTREKALLEGSVSGDKLSKLDVKETKCTAAMSSAEKRYVAFICKLCSSNVDGGTTSRLWLSTYNKYRSWIPGVAYGYLTSLRYVMGLSQTEKLVGLMWGMGKAKREENNAKENNKEEKNRETKQEKWQRDREEEKRVEKEKKKSNKKETEQTQTSRRKGRRRSKKQTVGTEKEQKKLRRQKKKKKRERRKRRERRETRKAKRQSE